MVAEMPGHRRHDRAGVAFDRRHLAGVMRRKPAADIDHAQIDIGLGEQREHARRSADGAVPLPQIGLLRADMERHAVRIEAEAARLPQEVDRHLGDAAEFARQRPVGAGAIDQDAAENPRPRGRPRQLLELVRAVEGEQAQSRAISKDDVLFLFYRVAERQPVRGHAVIEAQLDFAAAGHVEIGALAVEHGEDRRGRVGLYRIVDAGERQMPAQCVVSLGDGVQIDDEAGGLGRIFGEEARDPLIHYGG